MRNIEDFKDIHKGERCFIVGTGPSLNRTNLALLKDEIVFGVNGLHIGLEKFQIKPRYWGFSDPRTIKSHHNQVFPLPTTVFVAVGAREWYLDNLPKFKEFNNDPVVLAAIRRPTLVPFSTDITKGVTCGRTVVYDVCLQVAYYMGFSKVYLLGCDCDYSDHSNTHFYHDPSQADIADVAESLQPKRLFAYQNAKEAFEADKREIINCTVGGKLEIFKRERLEDVMKTDVVVRENREKNFFVVIANRNRFKLTSDCIKSLYQGDYPNFQVIVVDDASTDKSPDLISEHFPQVELIRNTTCLEFCKTFNVGIRRALERGADYVFVLSNDTLDFSKNYISRVIETFEKDDEIGLVGSKVLFENGTVRWGGESKVTLHCRFDTPDCGYVIRREVLEQVGLFDEDYIRYFELLDYILRLRNAGYKTQYVDDISFVHVGQKTVSRVSYSFHYYRVRATYVFVKQWFNDESESWKDAERDAVIQVNYKLLNDAPEESKAVIAKAIEDGRKAGQRYAADFNFRVNDGEIRFYQILQISPHLDKYLDGSIDEYEKLKDEIGTPKKVLELGCGIGRSSIFLKNMLNLTAKFYLADFDSNEYYKEGRKKEFLGYVKEPVPFNSLEVTKRFCIDNNLENLELVDLATDNIKELSDVDLVYSFNAVGYHWSIEDAVRKYDLENITTKDVKFIFGVRNKRSKKGVPVGGASYEEQASIIDSLYLDKIISGDGIQDYWVYRKR